MRAGFRAGFLASVVTLLTAMGTVMPAALAATYYIDYSTGSDSNSGTLKTTPWKRAPGMPGCTAVCASTSPKPGDNFILKGGVTWPNSSMQWNWQHPGTSSNRVYIGVDKTWFSGPTWKRPVLHGNGSQVSGGANLFLRIAADYVTFDNIEFTGALWIPSAPWGGNAYINPQTSRFIEIKNCYFHGWTNQDPSTDPGIMIVSSSHLPSLNVGMVLAYNVFDGSDTAAVQADPDCVADCKASGHAMWYGPNIHHNVCRYLSNCYVGAAETFHDNLIEHIRDSTDSTNHENAFENNSDPCTGLNFFNNVVRHIRAGVTVWLAPQRGCAPSYVWNNLIYDTTPGNVLAIAQALTNPGGTVHVYNNTVQCGPDGSAKHVCAAAIPSGITVVSSNNHWITSSTSYSGSGNITATSDIVQSQFAANAQGYTAGQLYAFSPQTAAASTAGAGANLAQACTGYLGGLCMDTTYSCAYDAAEQAVNCPARASLQRPLTLPWTVGAYHFVPAPSPSPPGSLVATAN